MLIIINNCIPDQNLYILNYTILYFDFIPIIWVKDIKFYVHFANKKEMRYIKNVFYKKNKSITSLLSFPINYKSHNLISDIIVFHIYLKIKTKKYSLDKKQNLYLHGFLHSFNFIHNKNIDFDIMKFLEIYLTQYLI